MGRIPAPGFYVRRAHTRIIHARILIGVRVTVCVRVCVCACTPRRRGGHVCACEARNRHRSRSPFPSRSLDPACALLLSFGGGGRRAVILRHRHHHHRRRRSARSTRSITAEARPAVPGTPRQKIQSLFRRESVTTHQHHHYRHRLARHSLSAAVYTRTSAPLCVHLVLQSHTIIIIFLIDIILYC